MTHVKTDPVVHAPTPVAQKFIRVSGFNILTALVGMVVCYPGNRCLRVFCGIKWSNISDQ